MTSGKCLLAFCHCPLSTYSEASLESASNLSLPFIYLCYVVSKVVNAYNMCYGTQMLTVFSHPCCPEM